MHGLPCSAICQDCWVRGRPHFSVRMTLVLVETHVAPKDGPPCASSNIQSGILTVSGPLWRFTVRAKPEVDEFLMTGLSLHILCQEHSGKERLHAEPARARPI